MSLLNLTPHPIRVYHERTPDRIDDLSTGLLFRLDPAATPCRIATVDAGQGFDVMDDYASGYVAPVRLVRFGDVDDLPAPESGTHYVVPLLVARDQAHRDDLIYPTREVRNAEGTVVGCRGFGRVIAPEETGLPVVLGWSNADTGPVGMRLYALDAGESPRWAKPHARVAEIPLMNAGAHEGDRFRIIPVDRRESDR